ncbi:phage tail tube protein [Caulobacter sp. UC70_42]|uniref:phage tail tube protein n=1 Tax=Caulobacter sp. UC70_42 TaxID=3374551 RepID=UPI0037582243
MPANIIDPVLGYTMVVKVQDQANATLYAQSMVFNKSTALSFSTKTVDDELVDLNDLSAPAQTVRRVASFDTKVDGNGTFAKADSGFYTAWATGNAAVRNCKISYANTTVTGPFVMTSFNITGERQQSVQAQITLEQAGAVTVTTV